MISKNIELNSKKNKDGKQSIYIRVTQSRKHKRISTGIIIFKKDFNPKAKYGLWVRSGEPKNAVYNELLKTKLSKLEDEIIGSSYSLNSLNKKKSFFTYAEEEEDYYNKVKKERSADKLKHSVNKLKEFLGEGVDLTFTDITPKFLKEYETHLLNTIGNHINTVQADFKRIKTCINNAIREGIVINYINPFSNFKIKYQVTNKEKLSLSDIRKLEKEVFKKDSKEWHAKNYFLFSYYCAGIRFGDFCTLKWKNVINDRLVYTMSKIEGGNHSGRSIPLKKQHLGILNFYKKIPENNEELIFPILDIDPENAERREVKAQISSRNVTVNRDLKIVQVKSKIKVNMTFHIARHSFADIARKQENVDIHAISMALGHSSIQTTQTYLAAFDVDDQDSLIDAVINAKI